MFRLIVAFLCLFFFSSLYAEKILFLGDSLTEGYGVPKDKAYPYVVERVLKKKGHEIEILNGSVSGSTTASSLSRLKWFLKAKPDWLFLALGANDGLRGIKVEESYKNLEKTVLFAKENKIQVAVAGMMVPPNYGEDYGKKFNQMYKDLKKKHGVKLMPFLLVNVAAEKEMNQEDGIHPNVLGHEKMGENVANFLLPFFKKQKKD